MNEIAVRYAAFQPHTTTLLQLFNGLFSRTT